MGMKKNHPMTEEEIDAARRESNVQAWHEKTYLRNRVADLEEKLRRMTADRNQARGLLIVARENVELNKVHRELLEKALSKMTAERDHYREAAGSYQEAYYQSIEEKEKS